MQDPITHEFWCRHCDFTSMHPREGSGHQRATNIFRLVDYGGRKHHRTVLGWLATIGALVGALVGCVVLVVLFIQMA